jgi:signal transduction histidine kinase/CheY-like chemotaxis protein
MVPPGDSDDPDDQQTIGQLREELRRLRKTNEVLVDRAEQTIDQEGSAFAIFQTAINLEKTIAERTSELSELNERLRGELETRKRIEAALLKAKQEAEQATRSKTRFVAAASHDLRQPLNAAVLYLESLDADQLSPRNREGIEGVQLAVETLNNLLNTLLDISRLDSGGIHPEPAHFVVNTLFDRLKNEYQSAAESAGLTLDILPCTAVAFTDRNLLETILRNLLANAVKYTERGRILLGVRRRGGNLRLQVIDTGAGIREEYQQRIFEEFWQAPSSSGSAQGSIGLGLSIVDRIARLLGSRVEVESVPGKGSCFSIDIPRGEAARLPGAEAEPGVPATASFQGRQVVIIDDNEQVLRSMERLLRNWNCSTIAARSAGEVLYQLIEGDLVPDLIIADYRLENDENGIDAIREINAEFETPMPALIVSSEISPELAAQLRALKLPLLNKPLDPAKLRALMQQLLTDQGSSKR